MAKNTLPELNEPCVKRAHKACLKYFKTCCNVDSDTAELMAQEVAKSALIPLYKDGFNVGWGEACTAMKAIAEKHMK